MRQELLSDYKGFGTKTGGERSAERRRCAWRRHGRDVFRARVNNRGGVLGQETDEGEEKLVMRKNKMSRGNKMEEASVLRLTL